MRIKNAMSRLVRIFKSFEEVETTVARNSRLFARCISTALIHDVAALKVHVQDVRDVAVLRVHLQDVRDVTCRKHKGIVGLAFGHHNSLALIFYNLDHGA